MDKTLAQSAEMGRRMTQNRMQERRDQVERAGRAIQESFRITRPHLHNQHVMTEIEVRCNFEQATVLPAEAYKWTGLEK